MSDEIKVIKEVEEQEQENIPQENPEEKRQREEMEAFEAEEGISFRETITKDDLIQYNYYLLKNPSFYFRMTMMVLLGIFLIVYPIIVKSNYWIIGVGAFLALFSLFLSTPLQKALIRKQVKKKLVDQYIIDVKVGQRIKYQLDGEKYSPLIDFKNIYKARKTPNYIFLHMGVYSVIILRLADCEQKDELVELVKKQFEGTNKYKELKK